MHPVNVTALKLRRQIQEQRIQRAKPAVPHVIITPAPVIPTVITEPVPDLALAIITADRQVDTLLNTVHSIRAAGFTQTIYIFSQAVVQPAARVHKIIDKNVVCKHVVVPLGCYYNWRYAANALLKMSHSWIMIMQDDIAWCKQGANILYRTLNEIDAGASKLKRSKLGLLSPYTSPTMVDIGDLHGWVAARYYGKIKGLWGALALCFPRESLQELVKNQHFLNHNTPRALDYVVGDTLRFHLRPTRSVNVHIPSIVQHTGECSTIYSARATSSDYIRRMRHGYRFNMEYLNNDNTASN